MVRVDTIGYKVRLIHNQIHKRMEAKRLENEGELTGMQRWTMGYLKDHDNQDIYQRDIEAEFSVSRATASNMLQVMERKDLIERVAVPQDARLKKIVLTDTARNMVEKAESDIRELESLLVQGMTEEEIKVLKKGLNHMLVNLGVQPDVETRCCGDRHSHTPKKSI